MDVKHATKHFFAHGRTLNVPTWTAIAPRAFPRRLTCFGGFPQHEIQRIAFETVYFHTLTCAQIIQRFARQLAISRKLAHGVIHIAIVSRIGFAIGNQTLNHFYHLRNVLSCLGFNIGFLHAQSRCVFIHGLNETGGQFADGFTILRRTSDDFVIDVGDVAHVSQRITRFAQPTCHHIKHHHHPRMAQVTVVIHRHPTHIHAHMIGI